MNCDSLIKKRTQNKSIILSYIKSSNQVVTQPDLCKKTGLSKVTVANIVNELKKERLIKISGQGKASSRGGRKPGIVKINKTGTYFIVVELDWNVSLFAILNFDNKIIKKHSCHIDFSLSSNEAIIKIAEQIDQLINNSDIHKGKISGIGVGMPGVINSSKGQCIYSAKFNWSNVSFADILAIKCDIPVFIEKNVSLQALAEYNHLFTKKVKTIFYISIGTGVGGAIIINGKTYNGPNFMAGEIGHAVVNQNGVQCPCGNKGCLQMYFSSQGFIAQAEALFSKGITFPFDREDPFASLWNASKAGNKAAMEILERGFVYLALQISGIIGMIDPEYIILGGKFIETKKSLIVNELTSRLNGMIFASDDREVKIIGSRIDENAALIGASSLVYDNLF